MGPSPSQVPSPWSPETACISALRPRQRQTWGPYNIHVPQDASLILDGPIALSGEGTSAPLLDAEGHLAIQFGVQITALGEEVVAVRASGPITLVLSRVESQGVAIEAPEVTLEGALAIPMPAGGQVRTIERTAHISSWLPQYGLWLDAGATPEELAALPLPEELEYGLSSRDVDYPILHIAPVAWTWEPVDPAVPVAYRYTGTSLLSQLGAVTLPECAFYLHVAAPGLPGLEAGYPYDTAGVRLVYHTPIREAEDLRLWYSADGKETWLDAAHYLVKPFTAQAAEAALDRCLFLAGEAERFVEVTVDRAPRRLLLSQLRYAEARGNTCVLYLAGEQVTTWLSLEELARLLDDPRFLRCQRSFLVNLDCCKEVRGTDFLLSDGALVPIRREARAEIKARFQRYLFEKAPPSCPSCGCGGGPWRRPR